MKNVLPRFQRPINGIDEPRIDVSFWDKAMDAYEAKKFRLALIETINYINPEVLKNIDTSKDIDIVQNQGSAEIHLKIDQKELHLSTPFLKIDTNTNKIALFRKLAEVNFNPLTLSQVGLKEDEVWFNCTIPVSLCQPYKVYDVIREISVSADDYDDEFVEKYKARFYKEPNIQPLTTTEAENVWQQLSNILEDYTAYSAFFKEKRWDNFQWDIVVISLLKIVNMPCTHGVLRTKLQEYVGNMMNNDIDFQYRIDRGTNFMKELVAKSKEDFMKDIYHAGSFISLKGRSSVKILQDETKYWERTVNSYVNNNDNFSLCYYLQYNFLYLLYNYNVSENQKNGIYNVLENVSGLPPNEAAPKLLKHFDAILQGKNAPKTTMTKGKGFFSKLFG